jgi:hypothetical protein
MAFSSSVALSATKQATEYELKMAYMYNFLKYVEWPREKNPDEAAKESDQNKDKQPEPILIGVVGKDPFGKAWEIIQEKKINDRKIVYKIFDLSDEEEEKQKIMAEEIRKCQLLFIPKAEEKYLDKILPLVRDYSVLTISETEDFLEQGGIINFVMEKNKIRFEINLDAAKEAGIQFKTSVLKLAKKIIQTKEKGGK